MATTTMTFTLKLLVDKHGQKPKVLFAEASKEFVDFLFYILSLPVGSIVRLLTKKNMVGCLGNLYESIENLSTNYIQPNFNKDCILKPKVVNAINVNPLLPVVGRSSRKNLYRCDYTPSEFQLFCDGDENFCHEHVADDPSAICPSCNHLMSASATYVASAASSSKEKGYVKEAVTYTVMDDLVVKPMSISSFTLLITNFNIKDIGLLEKKEVTFGMDETLKLIKASLESKTILTDVFLAKKSPAQNSSSARLFEACN